MYKYFIPIIGFILLVRDIYSHKDIPALYMFNQDSYIFLVLYTMFVQMGLIVLLLRYLIH